jgi:hypothetical protein
MPDPFAALTPTTEPIKNTPITLEQFQGGLESVMQFAVEVISPGSDLQYAKQGSERAMNAFRSGDPTQMGIGLAEMVAGLGAVVIPGSKFIRQGGKSVGKVLDQNLLTNARKVSDNVTEESIPAYHGTVKSNRGKLVFDKKRIHPTDQFLGEGFYFSLDKGIAREYANIRTIQFRHGADLPRSHPRNTGGDTFGRDLLEGRLISTKSVLKGVDLDGKVFNRGQEIMEVDLAGLNKTYMLKGNADRLKVKGFVKELKEKGYDSVAFTNFSDRSKQIMVFPEAIDKVIIK